MIDVDAIREMENVSGSRRELVRAATIASQLPVLNFGNIFVALANAVTVQICI